MPIFHDTYDFRPKSPDTGDNEIGDSTNGRSAGRRSRGGSRGRSPHENYEGILPSGNAQITPYGERRSVSRGKIIERIKRRQSPSWLHHHNALKNVQEGIKSRNASPRPRVVTLPPSEESIAVPEAENATHSTKNEIGLQIERPRSALHAGDFRSTNHLRTESVETSPTTINTSPVAPWHSDFPPTAFPLFKGPRFPSKKESLDVGGQYAKTRAFSHSSRSSLSNIVLMPPTSPLAQQSNNTDIDFSPVSPKSKSRAISRSPDRGNRRHTFSPQSFQTFRTVQHDMSAVGTPAARHLSTLRREGTYPYQAHQPRRSLTNISNEFSTSSPQTPFLRVRRPSIASESSPLHLAPMVGSYEESILRGRMSTTPSRPLNFVAQIGVMGRGECKPNLKCPAHVTVPFPAVFYSYNSGSGKIADDSPSPYVGLIDLENSLTPPDENKDTHRRRRRSPTGRATEEKNARHVDRDGLTDQSSRLTQRKQEKMKRRSTSPKAPPGGCYRIPQQGQLQIVIKNPNKTAVKLFLVPYDLSDMEPGQKTFIRQRSYSAGPIIDMPLSSRTNLGTDRPEAALSASDDPQDRPVLRYLIHLNICCPARGRFYLYRSVRVVFANRVPDGKEKLRNEAQYPEPRYSAYKPARDAIPNASMAAAQLVAENALRRRSAGPIHGLHDTMDGLGGNVPTHPYPRFMKRNSMASATGSIPFSLTRLETLESRPASRGLDAESPFLNPFETRNQQRGITASTLASPQSDVARSMDTEEEDGAQEKQVYGRSARGGVPRVPGEGLLARKLRGLDV